MTTPQLTISFPPNITEQYIDEAVSVSFATIPLE